MPTCRASSGFAFANIRGDDTSENFFSKFPEVFLVLATEGGVVYVLALVPGLVSMLTSGRRNSAGIPADDGGWGGI